MGGRDAVGVLQGMGLETTWLHKVAWGKGLVPTEGDGTYISSWIYFDRDGAAALFGIKM